MTSVSDRAKLRGRPALALAAGVVVLEFGAAVSTFVSATLLPIIARDLDAGRSLALLVAGTTIGLFTALPLSSRIIARYSPTVVLSTGLLLSVAGVAVAATARDPWSFGFGQLLSGFAGGVLAVYGIGAAIQYLEESLRLKVVAAMSAMWIFPALVGPSLTLAVEHLMSWRWALLIPVPLLLVGRLLVVRAVPPDTSDATAERPLGRTLLVPVGVATFVLLSASPAWWAAPVGLAAAVVGFMAMMPPGTGRVARGATAGLAGLTLFGFGYFGASELVTLLLTAAYDASLAQAGMVLSAAPIAWALASLLAPKLGAQGAPPAWGLALAAVAVAVVGAAALADGGWLVALVSWTGAGLGIGLSYPGLYLRATTEGAGVGASQLAAAVITTESFGGLVGGATGAALASVSEVVEVGRGDALAASYLLFAGVLVAAAWAAVRSDPPAT